MTDTMNKIFRGCATGIGILLCLTIIFAPFGIMILQLNGIWKEIEGLKKVR